MNKEFYNDYVTMHKEGAFHGKTIVQYKDAIKKVIKENKIKTALDYGCAAAKGYS